MNQTTPQPEQDELDPRVRDLAEGLGLEKPESMGFSGFFRGLSNIISTLVLGISTAIPPLGRAFNLPTDYADYRLHQDVLQGAGIFPKRPDVPQPGDPGYTQMRETFTLRMAQGPEDDLEGHRGRLAEVSQNFKLQYASAAAPPESNLTREQSLTSDMVLGRTA